MEKKVLSFMEEYHMVKEGDCVLAAVSGGADSLCLLEILLALQKQKQFRICVVHVEHGIRGKESMKDAEFVENFCKGRNIPCKVYHCQAEAYAKANKMTVEEGARALRYDFLEQASGKFGADKIAVAHNRNDCAETMLFHLARGTELRGLCGILPVRGKIIRPLLCVERKEIEAYLKKREQQFCVDSTNETLDYTRNKIRHQVLPVLEEINSQAVAHMNQTSSAVAEAVALMEELTEQALEYYIRRDKDGIHIPQTVLNEKAIIRKALFHRILADTAGSSRDISGIHVQQVFELFEKQVGKKLHLPYGMEAERTYDGVLLRKRMVGKSREHLQEKREQEMAAESCSRKQGSRENVWRLEPEEVLQIPSFGYEIRTRIIENLPQMQEIPKKRYTKWLDYDKIKGSMQLRTRREKDYFIINAEGGHKKLKNYFIDEKIPKQEREQILLLADETHILWAVGYRIGEDVKITDDTTRILEIQIVRNSGGRSCE